MSSASNNLHESLSSIFEDEDSIESGEKTNRTPVIKFAENNTDSLEFKKSKTLDMDKKKVKISLNLEKAKKITKMSNNINRSSNRSNRSPNTIDGVQT